MGIEEIRMLKLLGGKPKEKIYTPIPKKSAKKIKQEKEYDKDEVIWDWFKERRKDLTGKCKHCNGRTTKDDNDKFHFCIAHLLPKAYFPSVATHPLNFVELCTYGNNCHGNFDNKTLDLMDMNCFDEIVTKFVAIYPMIDKKERKRIPQVLLNYIEVEL